MNSKQISEDAKKIYDTKYLYPKSKLALRCVDFRNLEKIADTYMD